MSIASTLEKAKVSLEEIKRDKRFKKANLQRKEAVDLQVSLANCRGQLEICMKDFNRTIKTQSRNVREGDATGMDTLLQAQMLWDSAIGYMLVRDAIFSLKSINTSSSVSHAYEMLDEAVRILTGKNSSFFSRFGSEQERNRFGFITSTAALREKEDMLDTFFEELKMTGDIERCIENARDMRSIEAARRNAYAGVYTADDRDDEDILDSLKGATNIKPPKK